MLEVCLLWRLLRRELRGRYWFLFFYVVFCLLAMDLTLFVVRHTTPRIYAISYWSLELISVFLRFCVIWEIYRHTYPPGFLRQRASSGGWAMSYFWIALSSLGALGYLWTYSSLLSFYPAIECSLSFVQAALVLGLLLVSTRERIRVGRNVWGIAVGFGAYVSVNVLNFALLEMSPSLFHYYRTIVPISFAGMLAIWTWGLWTYAPNPRASIEPAKARPEEILWWTRRWERTLTAVRKVVNP